MDKTPKLNLGLYLVTDSGLTMGRPLVEIVEKAVRGGATIVQLREKNLTTADYIKRAKELKKVLLKYKVPLLINDRTDVALASQADGVHLGQNDMPCQMARNILGPDKIIGLSVENFDQTEEANNLDINYIAVSPVFTTSTKRELTSGLGLEGVRRISEISRHPVVGIGSIKEHNAAAVIKAGASGIAVVSALCSAEDPEKEAQKLIEQVKLK